MDKELYIEGELVDLGNDTEIAITKKINDIGSIDTVSGDLSNKFKLPFTSKNHRILGFANKVQSSTTKPYQKLSVRYLEKGIEIVAAGYCIFEQSSDGYEGTIYAGNAEFFALIDGLNLRDLDVSDMDHEWEIGNIASSRLNDEGYLYPIADYGNMSETGTSINTEELFPAFYTKTIIERIVSGQGWTLEGDILNHPMYQKKLIPFSNNEWKNPKRNPDETVGNSGQILYWVDPTGWTGAQPNAGAGSMYGSGTPANFTGLAGSPTLQFNNGTNFVSNQWVAPSNCKVKFTIDVSFTYISQPGTGSYKPKLVLWNKTQNIYLTVIDGTTIIQSNTATQTISIATIDINVNAGDTIELFIFNLVLAGNFDFDATIDLVDFIVEYLPEIVVGAVVNMSNQLPDMTQKEFMKGVFQQFSITPDADGWSKTLKFRSYSELQSNMHKAEEWGDDIFTGAVPDISYKIGNYGQRNNSLYIQDGETTQNFTSRELGNSYFEIEDETLEQSVDVIKLPFAATEMVKRLDNNIDVPLIDKLDDNGLPTKKVSTRVLMLRRTDQAWNLTYDNGITTVSINDSIPYCHFILDGQDDNLGFDNLLGLFYPPVIDSLNRAKMVKESLKLAAWRIQKFDFFIPRYSPKHQCYFYVNKINSFKTGSLTQCELIRL